MKRDPGLVELLEDPDDLDRVIQSNGMPNLWFISRGCNLSRPGDLLVGPALEVLFARLRQQFDHVIIDTSPVFLSDDVATLAPRADGTLFVVRSGVSRSAPVAEALDLLARRQAKILGIVINGADAGSKSYYYYKKRSIISLLPTAREKPSVKQRKPGRRTGPRGTERAGSGILGGDQTPG